MWIFEASITLMNMIFIFTHIFTFNLDSSFNWYILAYLSVFAWLIVLNYIFEGLKLQALLYIVAHGFFIYSEMEIEDSKWGISLGVFIALSITAMTLTLFLAPSPNVPI